MGSLAFCINVPVQVDQNFSGFSDFLYQRPSLGGPELQWVLWLAVSTSQSRWTRTSVGSLTFCINVPVQVDQNFSGFSSLRSAFAQLYTADTTTINKVKNKQKTTTINNVKTTTINNVITTTINNVKTTTINTVKTTK